jgi:hypothetical protein
LEQIRNIQLNVFPNFYFLENGNWLEQLGARRSCPLSSIGAIGISQLAKVGGKTALSKMGGPNQKPNRKAADFDQLQLHCNCRHACTQKTDNAGQPRHAHAPFLDVFNSLGVS